MAVNDIMIIALLRLLRIAELHEILDPLAIEIIVIVVLPILCKLDSYVLNFLDGIIILRIGAPLFLLIGRPRTVDQFDNLGLLLATATDLLVVIAVKVAGNGQLLVHVGVLVVVPLTWPIIPIRRTIALTRLAPPTLDPRTWLS